MNLARVILVAGILASLSAGAVGAAGPPAVKIEKTKLGKVVANKQGLTLYIFRADHGTTSSCYGQCASFWPPLITAGKASAGPGVKASLLGTTKRKDGKRQVTYKGHPLYRFKLDKSAGKTTGEGQDFYGGKWYAVNSAGAAVKHAPGGGGGTTTTSPYTTTTSPYPGY